MLNKRGVSGVIVTIILVAIVMIAAVIVWGVINNLIKGQAGEIESCFGNFGKISINNQYTCYNTTDNLFQFSLKIEDVDVEKVIVSISGGGTIKSFEITNTEQTISNLANYGSSGFGTDLIKLPGKNSGLTYLSNDAMFATKPDSIQISPVINGKQCEVSDSLSDISDC